MDLVRSPEQFLLDFEIHLAAEDRVPRIEVVAMSSHLLEWLNEDPARLHKSSPDSFENLIGDRLLAMGLSVEKVGKTFQRDGGFDFLASGTAGAFPYLLGVQVKYHRTSLNTGSSDVRELAGALNLAQVLHAGLLVTNTSFTPDAKWLSGNVGRLLMLRDFDDLKNWLRGEFTGDTIWREIPERLPSIAA